jgi:hypothetical protein
MHVKNVLAAAGIAGMLLPAVSFAQTTASLNQTLSIGRKGEDVMVLQALLAADESVYPEGIISGYYGAITAKAVRAFQRKNGLAQVGKVGPQTLKKLQNLLADHPIVVVSATSTGTTTVPAVCAHVAPGHLIAPGWLKKNKGVLPVVPDCQMLPPGIRSKLGGMGTTTDVTAPLISALSVMGLGTSSATIRWNTNESATNKVYYGTTSPLNLASALTASTASSTSVHAVGLSGLAPATTYYIVVESKDASGNTATSTQSSFTTLALPDTSAPMISAAAVSSVGSTTATVAWTTNEAATGKVYYGTSTPVSFGAASAVSTTTLSTSHSFSLSGLSASTTYYVVAESKDASDNAATSTQLMFTTTN